MKNILITGGAGYIGSHICIELLNANYNPIIIDNFSNSSEEVINRIHSEINQFRSDDGGTETGRFSYTNPNLQQIPARDPETGPLIRSLFIPEKGCTWGCFDYSQQEPRLVAH